MTAPRTIIVSRTDKIGDVVLTLPVFTQLRRLLPTARLVGHVRTLTRSLLHGQSDVDAVLCDDPGGRPRSIPALARIFRAVGADAIVLVHPSGRALLAAMLAGIPRRLGRASNIWQFTLTDRIAQNRSQNVKHETEYNQDLALALLDAGPAQTSTHPATGPSTYVAPRLELPPELRQAAHAKITQLFDHGAPVVVHPGGGGSALNLPPAVYADVAAALQARGIPVALSLGPGEDHLEPAFSGLRTQAGFSRLPRSDGDLRKYAALLGCARAFIGGSTGPLHLAAAVGCPTVAVFPPVAAMTPTRWGPYGNAAQIVKPDHPERCDGRCRACSHQPCWTTVTAATVVAACERLPSPAR